MTKEVQIIVEKDYSAFIPMIEVIRTCHLDDHENIIYGIGDPCLIKAIVTSRNCYNRLNQHLYDIRNLERNHNENPHLSTVSLLSTVLQSLHLCLLS